MKLFDLHCDTLYRALDENESIINNKFHLSVLRGNKYDNWIQCFAIWIPDDCRKDAAISLFKRAKLKFDEEISKNSNLIFQCKDVTNTQSLIQNHKCAAILTVEGGAVLAGTLNNLEYLKDCGVKMITLTWNGYCELGGGAFSKEPNGLTDFGKSVIKSMENTSIAIDVSHASDNLFYDVANTVKAPFVASHSNSRTVCNHKRNITDEQFNIIKSRKGLVGINFSKNFLSNDENNTATIYDILRHVEHFLSLGGNDIVCIGTDFDGTDMPDGILGIESMENLYELFLKHNYNESLVDDIFFNNAFNFFSKL